MFSWALCWLNADWDFKPSLGHDYQITETGVTTGSYLIGSGPGLASTILAIHFRLTIHLTHLKAPIPAMAPRRNFQQVGVSYLGVQSRGTATLVISGLPLVV